MGSFFKDAQRVLLPIAHTIDTDNAADSPYIRSHLGHSGIATRPVLLLCFQATEQLRRELPSDPDVSYRATAQPSNHDASYRASTMRPRRTSIESKGNNILRMDVQSGEGWTTRGRVDGSVNVEVAEHDLLLRTSGGVTKSPSNRSYVSHHMICVLLAALRYAGSNATPFKNSIAYLFASSAHELPGFGRWHHAAARKAPCKCQGRMKKHQQ